MYFYPAPTCSRCGIQSDDVEEEVDGYGIYLGRWCLKCRELMLTKYRHDIFERYQCDEPIEEET